MMFELHGFLLSYFSYTKCYVMNLWKETLLSSIFSAHLITTVALVVVLVLFCFVFFFTATHGISILRNMLENTNLEDKSLEPQRLPSSPALAFTPGAWGPLFSSHSEQHTMHAPASMFYSELLLKNLPSSTGDIKDGGLIPESGRYPGVGNSQTVNF